MTRSDPHRPGAIVPAHYAPVLAYNAATSQDGWPVPSFAVVCHRFDAEGRPAGVLDCPSTCQRSCACVARYARTVDRHVYGGPGKCGSCGARFVYGELWMHEPTGDYLHLGHDCAMKYELMMDRSAAELANQRARAAIATEIRKAERAEDRAAFFSAHPGLADAFTLGDAESDDRGARILADLAERFVRFTSLSDKQVSLAMTLADRIRNPGPVEVPATAPTGKGVTFTGEVVSAKLVTSEQWGASWKITVKVTTLDGVWLAWGTAPRSLMDHVVAIVEYDATIRMATQATDRPIAPNRQDAIRATLRGMEVECKATLERPSTEGRYDNGRRRAPSTNFVFMSRPTIYPMLCNHPERSATRIKAERAYEAAIEERRDAMSPEFAPRYTISRATRDEAIAALAADGITMETFTAAKPRTRKAS